MGRDTIDLVCSLGGDGTTLHVSSLFPHGATPPVLSFSLGTLGFLMPFNFNAYQEVLTQVMEGQCFVVERARIRCSVHRADSPGHKGGVTPPSLSLRHTRPVCLTD